MLAGDPSMPSPGDLRAICPAVASLSQHPTSPVVAIVAQGMTLPPSAAA